MVKQALISLDTDQIMQYIFASPNLKEIRGASALLDWLNRIKTPELLKKYKSLSINGELIYANGGSAMAFLDETQAVQFLQEVEKLYRIKTVTGSITGATFVPGNEEDLRKNFKINVKELQYQLRRAKETGLRKDPSISSVRTRVALPFLKYCDACGTLPACRKTKDDRLFLCSACRGKRVFSELVRERNIDRHKILLSQSPLRQFLEYVRSKQTEGKYLDWGEINPKSMLPKSFTDIGQVSRVGNYIGFIYCDGNNMGKVLEELSSPEEYMQFAESLDKRLKSVTFETLLHHFVPRKNPLDFKEILPFEFIMLGGDDLILVTAADKALEIAVDILQNIEETVVAGKKITFSAGVVLAHCTYPIVSLHEMAKKLMASAKNYRQRESLSTGTMDYLVISNATSNSLDNLRNHDLKYKISENDSILLTQRPFTLEIMKHLICDVRKMKNAKIPTSKLHALYKSLFDSKAMGMLKYIEVVSRLSSDGQKKVMREFFDHFGVNKEMPWKDVQTEKYLNSTPDYRYVTPVLDLVEIYDFITSTTNNEEAEHEQTEFND